MIFKKLSKKALIILNFRLLTILSLLFFASTFLYFSFPLIVIISAVVITVIFLLTSFFYFPLYYKTFRYTVTDDALIVIRGVFKSSRKYMYLKSIKYISIVSLPDTRLFKLSTVIVLAAGASVHIPFIDKKACSDLYSKLNSLRMGGDNHV